MDVHLVDGTYELFRHYHALPSMRADDGREVAAVRGVLGSMLSLLRGGATHVGVATDHVVESFRNELWQGYKTGHGVPEDLMAQFPLLEEALQAMGIVVWPMIELEADDALAAAAQRSAQDRRVGKVYICTPDKDLAQCVVGERVVQLDRRSGHVRDAAGVEERFGVPPAAIPEYLALVGDTADGFPGVPGWGPKSAAAVLQRYARLEAIPKSAASWHVELRNAARLSANLVAHWDEAILFRRLATLRNDTVLFGSVAELRWTGPQPGFQRLCAHLGDQSLWERTQVAAEHRARRT